MGATDRTGDSVVKTEAAVRKMFVAGWFTDTFEKGVQPDYGYPKNHLPEVPRDFVMAVKTGFFSQR